jgi:hypothetical protein
VVTPGQPDEDLIPVLPAASRVLGTCWFGADAAQAEPGNTVAVVRDGAVGLMAVLGPGARLQLRRRGGSQESLMQAVGTTRGAQGSKR